MGKKSGIEWTDDTDNVIVTVNDAGKPNGWYCQKVSPGCAHCYAETLNKDRFGNGMAYRVPADGTLPPLLLRRDILAGWARQTRPRRHFVNSMTDTFADFVPTAWIYDILDAMTAAPRQTFQILTKRAERMETVVIAWLHAKGLRAVPANIWLGVSIENQEWADRRIPHLLCVPAAVRFLSCEPLLGPVDLGLYSFPLFAADDPRHYPHRNGVDWVIVGGESGPNARPMHPKWAQDIRDQCVRAGTPFFFKQWGSYFPVNGIDLMEWYGDYLRVCFYCGYASLNEACQCGLYGWKNRRSANMVRVHKKAAGRLLDGREWNEFPQGANNG